jgi:hypothetical protein
MNYGRMSFGFVMPMMWALAPLGACGQTRGHEYEGRAKKLDAGHQHEEESSGHSHAEAAACGGSLAMTREFHFESVFTPAEKPVHDYDVSQNRAADSSESTLRTTCSARAHIRGGYVARWSGNRH